MEESPDHPIAVCQANEVEVWFYPFFVRPATGLEPTFIFLEDHLYNLEGEELNLLQEMVRIDSEDDLRRLGFTPDDDGIYRL